MEIIFLQDLGMVAYNVAWDYQETLLKANIEAKSRFFNEDGANKGEGADTVHHLLFCEHPHVYTIGKSGEIGNLLANNEQLQAMHVSFVRTNRGGDITYHGPGQVVGYPIIDLERFFTDIGRYMRNLEEVIIRTLSHYGIEAGRLSGSTGVWLNPEDPSRARKICAMGVRSSRWVTMHGFALNVNTDLKYFNYIIPCGITDKGVTSMQKELGHCVDEVEVKEHIIKEFGKVFEAEIVTSAESFSG